MWELETQRRRSHHQGNTGSRDRAKCPDFSPPLAYLPVSHQCFPLADSNRKQQEREPGKCSFQGPAPCDTQQSMRWSRIRHTWLHHLLAVCFPGGSDDKESACSAGDLGSILGLGRSPGAGNGNPLQYSCLKNPMDRGAWWTTVHGVTKSRT